MATAAPVSDALETKESRRELTWRGVLLVGLPMTLVFTAANVYLGLKVGLTFASSIPAAVISMAVLRMFKNATIYENNIVQTVASAAGTLSSIIFVLPGLVMIGWWTGFPFWQSFLICALGGILGVMYSVPLRRALVTQSDLPYPEGVAAAEVLKVGVGSKSETPQAVAENKAGLVALTVGSLVSAGFALLSAAKVFTDTVSLYARIGLAATGMGFNMSLALVGAGHLIGIVVGIAIGAGLFISWGILVPVLTALHPAAGPLATVAENVWRGQVRFIGAGTIGISAIWTLLKLVQPIVTGVTSALAASRERKISGQEALPRTEQDLPIGIVALISLACFIPIAALLAFFLAPTALAPLMIPLVLAGVAYIVLAGFLVAAACGYMAGLIGSSNSPVSGLGILTIIGASLLLLVVARNVGTTGAPALVAFALFVTAVLLNVATISNDNLQDLKTGQLVNATPWRQQVALIFGCIFGALIIPPVLSLLNSAYGFTGGPHSLPAPQATLISTLAKGVIQGQIRWDLIGIGAAIGAVIILIDEILVRRGSKIHLPPLAVGLGIYLPAGTTSPAVIGALCGWAYNRYVEKRPSGGEMAKRLGVLVASGLIVGESIFGVINAGLIVLADRGYLHVADPSAPLAVVGASFAGAAQWLGGGAFVVVIALLYMWIANKSARVGRA